MPEQRDLELVGIMYVGGLSKVEARFPERGLSIVFERSVVRYVKPEVAALFTPADDWVVGVSGGDVHKADSTAHVLVRRGVALGDVLCVHGALQGIMRAYPGRYRISYQVAPIYREVFEHHPSYEQVLSTDQPISAMTGIDHFLSLDALLERDHNIGEDKISRVDRTYRHFFAARPDLMSNPQLKPDFKLVIPEVARKWAFKELDRLGLADSDKPIIAVASRAIQKPRNLGEGYVKAFTDALTTRYPDHHVLLIEHDAKHIWETPNVHGFIGSSVLQAMALMQECDVLCTMDSGAMWMGHCIPIPMVCWFGPTPPETKCNYHEFYPEGIRALRMWRWIDCPAACYEAATWCNFEYRCVKSPPKEKFIEETIQGVVDLVQWNRKHGKAKRDTFTRC